MMKLVLLFSATVLVLSSCAHKSDPAQAGKGGQAADSKSHPSTKGTKTAPAESPPVTKGNITIIKSVACRSVEKRGPVAEAEIFPSNVGRVYLFNQIKLDVVQEATIQHIWSYKDKKMAKVVLPIHGPQWRTYSSKVIDPSLKGEWKVDITNAEGEVIKTQTFKIE